MSFNELQRQVADFDKRFGWVDDKSEHTLIHMQEELGEISTNILNMSGYRDKPVDKEDLNDELVDLLYLTLKLANSLGLEVDSAWDRVDGRYSQK